MENVYRPTVGGRIKGSVYKVYITRLHLLIDTSPHILFLLMIICNLSESKTVSRINPNPKLSITLGEE